MTALGVKEGLRTPSGMVGNDWKRLLGTRHGNHRKAQEIHAWLEMFVREKSNVSFFQPSFRTGAFCSFANVEHEELKSSVGKNDFGLSNEMVVVTER